MAPLTAKVGRKKCGNLLAYPSRLIGEMPARATCEGGIGSQRQAGVGCEDTKKAASSQIGEPAAGSPVNSLRNLVGYECPSDQYMSWSPP